MKKEIIQVDKKRGVYRITTLSERWYAQQILDVETGLPAFKYYPSSTWIAGCYPKGIAFYKWLANKGWDEAEALKTAAGDKGSKVHYACGDLDEGKEIDVVNGKYVNNTSQLPENLSQEEVDCILSYRDFLEEWKPQILANEISAFGDFYAGTIDKIFRVKNEIWILDLKTSQSMWPEYELQLSSYKYLHIDYKKLGITDEEWANRKLFVLQIGYKLNKKKYKLNPVDDKYDLFKMAYGIWKNENPGARPKEAEYPLFIKSNFRIEQLQGANKSNIEILQEAKIKVARK